MERDTPEFVDTYQVDFDVGYGGDKGAQILALVANDFDNDGTDGQMTAMTDHLQVIVTESGTESTRYDWKKGTKGNEAASNIQSSPKLYLTGHSRYYDKQGKVVPLRDRKLGGFDLHEVIEVLYVAVTVKNINYIEFWCCETASKKGTQSLKGDENKQCSKQLQLEDFRDIHQNCQKQADFLVSTLDYVCLNLAIKLAKQDRAGLLEIRGLNGVGIFEPGYNWIKSFDPGQNIVIEGLEEKIKLEQNKPKGRQDDRLLRQWQDKLELENKKFQQLINAKGCHYIAYTFDMNVLQKQSLEVPKEKDTTPSGKPPKWQPKEKKGSRGKKEEKQEKTPQQEDK
jgi:hypothetical protein